MRLTTGFVLWLVAAGVATAVGLAAVAAIGTNIFGEGRDPLTQSEVDDLLTSRSRAPATTSPTSPTTTQSPPPPAAPAERSTVTEGGEVIARCTANGLVEILSATPAQGYQVDPEDDLEDHPSVTFFSGGREIEVRLRCANGAPTAEIKVDDD